MIRKPSVCGLLLGLALFAGMAAAQTTKPKFKALAFYSTKVEFDHVLFAEDALKFFPTIAAKDGFEFEATTDWSRLNASTLKDYQLVLWLNDSPTAPEQRQAFQAYMEHGGAWLGFHAAAYNDKDTGWPWFVDLLGGAVFEMNSWPPLPAKLDVDDPTQPAVRGVPSSYLSPANEWYVWNPSPRLNKDVRVLLTLDASNYPIGIKDVLLQADLPAAWSNTKYKMIYMNMGHGNRIFQSAVQNRFIENCAVWLGTGANVGVPLKADGLRVSPHAVATNSKTGKVYGVSIADGRVLVIDNGKHSVKAVKVGEAPGTIAINPETNRIYVGNTESGTVSVLDGATDEVIATVDVGALPYVVTVNPVTNRIYVAKTFSNFLTLIDGATNKATALPPGLGGDAIEANPAANKVYFVSYEGKELTVLDGATNATSKIGTAIHSWGVAVDAEKDKVYLGNTGGANATAVDGRAKSAMFVTTGEVPCAFGVDPAANRVYAANCGSNTVAMLDGSTNRVLKTITVGGQPHGVGVNPAGHRVFVANTLDNTVSILDSATDAVLATVPAGRGPYAVAVDTTANKAYVANYAGDAVTEVDGVALTSRAVTVNPKQ